MTEYTFSTLNDKDFEVLVRDLLSKELKVEFQHFKSGKDKGIDLRYSTSNDNEIIVQAKHYLKSGYKQLIRDLKNKELNKVIQLKPKRYIVVISNEINPQQAEEIKEIFKPYIKSIDDIYWNQRLNSLLRKFEDVERQHFKLWFSSTNVLQAILNNSSHLKSKYLSKEIEERVSLYVKTNFHKTALEILKKQKVLLITGAPGVGKTTLAQMITFDFIKDGFQHLVIEDHLDEAENIIKDDDSKQIIYFDDFLGSNIYEVFNPRNSENALVRFISRIKSSPNKFLILTTRTTILNHALLSFEKIRHKGLHKDSNFEIYLNEYTLIDKAEILYNHLFFSQLEQEYIEKIFADKNYFKIIKHDNYNPRLIEFFTTPNNLYDISSKDYLRFILSHLDNPEEIWKNSYNQQIQDEERFLLNTLFSLRGSSELTVLETAFNRRIKYEIAENGHKPSSDAFNTALKKLQSSYLNTEIRSKRISSKKFNPETFISFVNPSISDFLINHFRESQSERKRLIEGTQYLEQITNLFHPYLDNYIKFKKTEQPVYFKNLIKRKSELKTLNEYTDFDIYFLKILFELFYQSLDESIIISHFNLIHHTNVSSRHLTDYVYILERTSEIDDIKKIVKENWTDIILNLYNSAVDEDDYDKIYFLFEEYDEDYDAFISIEENENIIVSNIKDFLSDSITELIKDDYGNYTYRQEEDGYIDENGNYIIDNITYHLDQEIDDIVEEKFQDFESRPFLSGGPYFYSWDLGIDTAYIQETIEDTYTQSQYDSYEPDYEDFRGKSGLSEIDIITNLFEK
jgi:hypothetical protein